MLFLPGWRMAPDGNGLEDWVQADRRFSGEGWLLSLTVCWQGQRESHAERLPGDAGDAACEYSLARMLYTVWSGRTGRTPPWGILTGVRPVKLLCRALERGEEPQALRRRWREELLVSEKKFDLALRTARLEGEILAASGPMDYSLYVSIPFCPTRCRYCSFVSHAVEKAGELMPQYLELLCRELQRTGEMARERGLRLSTVYIGGGTPTALPAPLLRQLTEAVAGNFPLGQAREYTVEAGRPDTVDREKLQVLRQAGVTRLSINPQTMQQPVLDAIGRRHTVKEVYEAFALARELGFDNINMDLIAGLTGDTPAGFADTLRQVLALGPENITLHTLSVKRAADLREEQEQILRAGQAEPMVDLAVEALSGAGYLPYYLYRQKNMVENLENTGWCKPGFEGYYNVYIMDETHTIAAVGAGAVTKLRQPGGGRLERIFNFKYPYEYIRRFDELMARKERLGTFYSELAGEAAE